MMRNQNKRKARETTHIILAGLALYWGALSASPAQAVTNEEIIANLPEGEQSTFVLGMVQMLIFVAGQSGASERAACIFDFYFRGGGGPTVVSAAMREFPEKTPEQTVYAVVNGRCGDPN